MPSLTYSGEPDRVYPFLGLEPVPGESYDLDEAPEDGHWSSTASPSPAYAPPFTPPEPSVIAEPTTTTEA